MKKIKNFFFGTTPKLILWQASVWDKFAKISPFIVVTTVAILYSSGDRNWELIRDGLIIFSITFGVVWWFWIIYTIATIAAILDKSQYGLKEVIEEIREMHKEINNIRKEG